MKLAGLGEASVIPHAAVEKLPLEKDTMDTLQNGTIQVAIAVLRCSANSTAWNRPSSPQNVLHQFMPILLVVVHLTASHHVKHRFMIGRYHYLPDARMQW